MPRWTSGEEIRRIRGELGLSQADAARAVGRVQSTQSKLEGSERVDDPFIVHVYTCLRCRRHFLEEGVLVGGWNVAHSRRELG